MHQPPNTQQLADLLLTDQQLAALADDLIRLAHHNPGQLLQAAIAMAEIGDTATARALQDLADQTQPN